MLIEQRIEETGKIGKIFRRISMSNGEEKVMDKEMDERNTSFY